MDWHLLRERLLLWFAKADKATLVGVAFVAGFVVGVAAG